MSSKTKTTAKKEEATPTLVPKLRFPEFLIGGSWKEVRIESILAVRDERRVPSKDAPLYSLTIESGITAKTDRYNREFLVTDSGNKKYKLVEPNDIVYNPSNLRWGAINYSQHKHSVVVSPIYEVLSLEDCSENFLEFIACSVMRGEQINRFITKGQGTLVERIAVKIDDFISTELPVPPTRAEQQKIAECLSSVDELIAAQARKVDALKTHKKGLMQQLFPREGETQPRLRFPEFQNAGEWEVNELGRISDVRDGTHDSPSFFQTGRPLVTSKNLRPDGTLDLENVSLISEEDYEQINKRSKVSVGDILFGMIGTIGNPVLIKSEGFAIKNVALIKEVGPLYNAFLVQLLKSGYVAAIFAVLNTGNSQKFIALGKIRGLPVPVPSLPEQQRIATCLSSLDALITAETQKHAALKTHKKGLMQRLFPVPAEVGA